MNLNLKYLDNHKFDKHHINLKNMYKQEQLNLVEEIIELFYQMVIKKFDRSEYKKVLSVLKISKGK